MILCCHMFCLVLLFAFSYCVARLSSLIFFNSIKSDPFMACYRPYYLQTYIRNTCTNSLCLCLLHTACFWSQIFIYTSSFVRSLTHPFICLFIFCFVIEIYLFKWNIIWFHRLWRVCVCRVRVRVYLLSIHIEFVYFLLCDLFAVHACHIIQTLHSSTWCNLHALSQHLIVLTKTTTSTTKHAININIR